MDADRDRPRAHGLRPGLAGGPDAGRRAGRCRPLRADRRRHGGLAYRRQRTDLCDMADLPGRAGWRRRCRPPRAACWARPSRRSASAWSDMPRSASGSAAMRVSPPSAPGLSAAVMGACGYFFSAQAVFFVTAALLVPALLVLRGIVPAEIDPERAHGNPPANPPASHRADLRSLPAQAAATGLRLLHPAVPPRQRGHASPHGQRAHDALEPMGDGADRGLHRRAAARRGAVLAMGRPAGATLGTPAAAARRLRRSADPRTPLRHGDGSLPAGRRSAPGRADGRRVQRDGAARPSPTSRAAPDDSI